MTPVRIRAQPCATTSGCSETRRETTEKMRSARKIRADARPRLRLAPYPQHSAAPSRSALHWRIDEKLSPSRASCRCRVRRLMPRRDATWSLEAWCETSKSCTTQRPCSLRVASACESIGSRYCFTCRAIAGSDPGNGASRSRASNRIPLPPCPNSTQGPNTSRA